MKSFQGFTGFTGMSQFSQDETPAEEPVQGQGAKTFEKMMQQMQSAQQAKTTAAKSKVDMLWPMGTAMKGKQ